MQALVKNGMVVGNFPMRVLPSKTAIVPVNECYLPKSTEELKLCARTIYVANIDMKVTQGDVRRFFESLCGKTSYYEEVMLLSNREFDSAMQVLCRGSDCSATSAMPLALPLSSSSGMSMLQRPSTAVAPCSVILPQELSSRRLANG